MRIPVTINIMRTALFGGSFDPPHLGHLAIAEAAHARLQLDRIFFTPVGLQPLKPAGASASFPARCAMTQLAIAGQPYSELSLADAPNATGTPNYTIDTLLALRVPSTELYCLLGADSLRGLRRWHRAAEIPFAATLAIATRPHEPLDDLAALLPDGLAISASPQINPGLITHTLTNGRQTALIHLLTGLDYDISATTIRKTIYSGDNHALSRLIPPSVAEYIALHGLYCKETPQNGLK